MKRVLKWAAVLCLTVAVTVPATAQDKAAKAVIDRYEAVTGLNKLTEASMNSMMLDATTVVMGMDMPMKMVVKQPDKLWVEMEMNGQKMLMVASDGKGWIRAAGQVQPMPAETMDQMKEQMANIAGNYRWNEKDFGFEMAGELKEGGKTYQGVHMVPKKTLPEKMENMIVYFDKESGLVDFLTMDVSQGGEMVSARMDFSDYKTFGPVRVSSKYKMKVGDTEVMRIEIKAMEYDYPAPDTLFAKPE